MPIFPWFAPFTKLQRATVTLLIIQVSLFIAELSISFNIAVTPGVWLFLPLFERYNHLENKYTCLVEDYPFVIAPSWSMAHNYTWPSDLQFWVIPQSQVVSNDRTVLDSSNLYQTRSGLCQSQNHRTVKIDSGHALPTFPCSSGRHRAYPAAVQLLINSEKSLLKQFRNWT